MYLLKIKKTALKYIKTVLYTKGRIYYSKSIKSNCNINHGISKRVQIEHASYYKKV